MDFVVSQTTNSSVNKNKTNLNNTPTIFETTKLSFNEVVFFLKKNFKTFVFLKKVIVNDTDTHYQYYILFEI